MAAMAGMSSPKLLLKYNCTIATSESFQPAPQSLSVCVGGHSACLEVRRQLEAANFLFLARAL